jgi:hypothetical protein
MKYSIPKYEFKKGGKAKARSLSNKVKKPKVSKTVKAIKDKIDFTGVESLTFDEATAWIKANPELRLHRGIDPSFSRPSYQTGGYLDNTGIPTAFADNYRQYKKMYPMTEENKDTYDNDFFEFDTEIKDSNFLAGLNPNKGLDKHLMNEHYSNRSIPITDNNQQRTEKLKNVYDKYPQYRKSINSYNPEIKNTITGLASYQKGGNIDDYIKEGLNPQEDPTIYDNTSGPFNYGVNKNFGNFSTKGGMYMDPMTNTPGMYGSVGFNKGGFNTNLEHKKGFNNKSTSANLGYSNKGFNSNIEYSNEYGKRFGANIGYNSPNFNAGLSYSSMNKQPEFDANLGVNKGNFNSNLGYNYGSKQHSFRGNVGYNKGDYNFNVSGEKSPYNTEFKVGMTKQLGTRPTQKQTPIVLPEFDKKESGDEAAYPLPKAQTGRQINIDGNQYNTNSPEYKKLYNQGQVMPVDSEGLPTQYISGSAWDDYYEDKRKNRVADNVRRGTGQFTKGLLQGAGAGVLGAGEIASTPIAMGTEFLSGRGDYRSALPNPQRILSDVGVGNYDGNYQQTPGSLVSDNPFIQMVVDLPIDVMTGRAISKYGPRSVKYLTNNKNNKVFKSKIDWSKWNPETPNYPELIDEYNKIEESTKKASTWMKNPDGSEFRGTPEQFIQQQSSHFKKAFGDSKLIDDFGSPQIIHHGTNKPLVGDQFNLNYFGKTDDGWLGKGIYTHPRKKVAEGYAYPSNLVETKYGGYEEIGYKPGEAEKLYPESRVYNLYGNTTNPLKVSKSDRRLIQKDFGRSNDDGFNEYDAVIDNTFSGEIMFRNPTQLKSATGNVGFFDMNNPNIYKGLAPIGIATGAAASQMQPREEYQKGGEFKFKNQQQAIYPFNEGGTDYENRMFDYLSKRDREALEYSRQFQPYQPQQYTIQEEGDFLPNSTNPDDVFNHMDNRTYYYTKQAAISPYLSKDYNRKTRSLENELDQYMSKHQEGGRFDNYNYKQPMYNHIAKTFVTPHIAANTDKDFVRRIVNPKLVKPIIYPNGEEATHKMMSMDYSAMPLVRNEDGRLIDYDGHPDIMLEAVNKNYNQGEYIDLPNPELADKFANEYKSFWNNNVKPTRFKYQKSGSFWGTDKKENINKPVETPNIEFKMSYPKSDNYKTDYYDDTPKPSKAMEELHKKRESVPFNHRLEWNAFEIAEPTGFASIPDVIEAWSDGEFNYNDITEPLGELPAIKYLKYLPLFKTGAKGDKIIPKYLPEALNTFRYIDAADDIYNDHIKYRNGGQLPCLTCGGYMHRNKMQSGGQFKPVSQVYTEKTGEPWQTAKQKGLTDGSYDANIKLLEKLNNNEIITQDTSFFRPNRSINVKSVEPVITKPDSGGIFSPIINQVNSINNILSEKLKENTGFEDWDKIKEENNKINKLSDIDKINYYKKKNDPNSPFVVIDKKNSELLVYNNANSKPIKRKVSLGKNQTDAQTVTKYRDINNDGKITDADKVNGKFQVDWDAGNMSTGAGRYYISNIDRKGYYDLPLINMMNERQYDQYLKTGKVENVATSIHMGYDPRQARISNGCVRGDNCTLDDVSKITKNNNEVYILPEEKGNRFVYENGKLNFKADSRKINPEWQQWYDNGNPFAPIPKKYLQGNKYEEYVDSKGKIQKGQGINKSVNTLNYIPIKTALNPDFSKRSDIKDDQYNERIVPFVKSLENGKQDIMKLTGINGDVYNEIAKMTFGIYGAETRYGMQYGTLGNFGRAIGKWWDPKNSSSPDYNSKYNTYGATSEDNSVGLTQLRWSFLNDKEKSVLKELGITSNKDFMLPENAAVGTAAVLAIRYQEQLNEDQKQQMWNHLPNKWNSRPNYPQRVSNNSKNLKIYQKNN